MEPILGIVQGLYGSPGSGLATLELETDEGLKRIHCDAGPTYRALRAMFGSADAATGHQVFYVVDDLGILLSLEAVSDE